MSKNKKLIIFGPWCGEFCYELSWWIPEIRKRSKEDFHDCDVISIGYEGRGFLYKDFSDKYFAYPQELEDTLLYPSTCGQHDTIQYKDIIPDNITDFTKQIATSFLKKYDKINVYLPNTMPMNSSRTLLEQPYGEYKHYKASKEVLKDTKSEILFNNDRETIAIMARVRKRLGKTCYLDWNPKNWEIFVDKLINDLKVNVVMIGIDSKENSSAGSSLTFENSKYIKNITFKGPDSVEKQIALLQSTKCSIYGASGTAVFPFFIKDVATFTQQTDNEGFRLKFQWERDLTNNLKNIKIFDKYKNSEIYNSPPDELYQEFKTFYQTLKIKNNEN